MEPIVEILAEPAFAHFALEIAIRRRNDPHVGLAAAARTERLELALLKHPQELGLHVARQLADLIEEDGALLGHGKAPFAALCRAGEGAALVPEELALDQGGGDGGAVDRNQVPGTPPAGGMDGAGDELLAGSGLAEDEHRGVGAAHLIHLTEDAEERFALAEDAACLPARAELLPQPLGFRGQRFDPRVAPDDVGHGAQPAELGRGASAEDLKDRQEPRIGRHGLRVEDREVPEHLSIEVEEWHAEIAGRSHRAQIGILGIELDRPVGDVDHARVLDHGCTGCVLEVVFEVGDPLPSEPEGMGPQSTRVPEVLRDPCPVDVERFGQALHQRGEELLAGFGGRAGEDPLEHASGVMAAGCGSHRLRPIKGCLPACRWSRPWPLPTPLSSLVRPPTAEMPRGRLPCRLIFNRR